MNNFSGPIYGPRAVVCRPHIVAYALFMRGFVLYTDTFLKTVNLG